MKIIKPILLVISLILPIVSSAITIEPANIIVKSGESVTLTVNGADSGTYKWQIPAGHLSSVFGKPLSLNTQGYTEKSVQYHVPKKAGNYEVEVSVNGSKAIANITVYLDLIVSPTKLKIKAGETASLQAYGGVPPFTWSVEQGNINPENTTKVTYQAPSDINNTTLQVKDAVGNVIIVPIRIITPLSVNPESISLQPKTSKLVNLSGGLPPFTSIVQTGSGKLEQEDTNLLFTAPPVYGTSIIEIIDAASHMVTIPVTILAPFTASPSNISIDKEQNATFQIWGGEPPYQVAARLGSASCDQTGACTYTAPAQYGPDIVEVLDNRQKKIVIFITVEGGTPTILPNNPRLAPREIGIFTVEGGCISYQTKNYPYQWAWEADIITSLSENGQMIQVPAPEQEGFYKLSVRDACGTKQEVMVHVTAAEEPLPVATFTITPNETVDVNEAIFFDAKTDQDPEGKKYTYDWNFGDNISDKGFRASHTYKTSGSFNVKLTVTDNKGRQTEAVRTVRVLPEVEKMRTVPAQATLYPKENLEIKIAGGISPYTITAERGRLTQTTGDTTTYIAPNITGPDLIIATDQNGKVAKVIIDILREIQVTPIRPLIYPGDKQKFNVIGGKGPYTWSTTVGEIEIVDQIEKSEINFVVPDASIVPRISVTDSNNKSVNVFPRISTKIRISPQTIALKPNKLHNFTAINGVGTIKWHTNGGDLTQFEGNSTNYLAPHVAGTYKVLATDSKGDSAQAMIYVNLLPVITPAMSILQTGEETTFRVLRGTPPYTWTVTGAGKIISTNQNGDLATFRASTTAGRATIIATDSEGKIVQAIVSIQLPNSFAISPTEIHLEPEKTTTLQARGADTVKWSSQLGQLSSLEGKTVTYIAPKDNDVDIITATNDKGESSNAIIFIGGRVTGNGNFYAHVDDNVENHPNIIGVWNINNPEDKPQTKTLYVAINMEEKGLHIVTPTEWQTFNGVDIPVYQQNIKANATKFNIMKNRDVTSLPAFQILLGYGVGENPLQNMLENNKFGVIYP